MLRFLVFFFFTTPFFLLADDSVPGNLGFDQVTFLNKGVIGTLRTPMDLTQYYLITCQPRKAWQESQKIEDEKLRNIFQGVVLTLISTERPFRPDSKTKLHSTDKPVIRLPLDLDEIWSDEVEDLEVHVNCMNYPLAEANQRQKLRIKAQELLKDVESYGGPSRFEILALASDVGVSLHLTSKDLEQFRSQYAGSPYFKRFESFIDNGVDDKSTLQIQNLRAVLPAIKLTGRDLTFYSVEIPWLITR